jgi:hypothetical protein
VNRTQVYERKNQLEKILEGLELAGAGRPSIPASEVDDIQDRELCEKVLRYRLEHPGAVVLHMSGRATYSNGFVRYILDLLDEQSLMGKVESRCYGNIALILKKIVNL